MSERSKRLRETLAANGYLLASMQNTREVEPNVFHVDIVPVTPETVDTILDWILIEKLPTEGRFSITREFNVNYRHSGTDARGKVQFTVIAGMYADGRLGEIFISGEKMGETVVGALDMVAMAISMGLQHGVSLPLFINKLKYTRGVGDDGLTGDPEFPFANSLFDLIAKWLEKTFPDGKYVNQRLQDRQPPSDERESK